MKSLTVLALLLVACVLSAGVVLAAPAPDDSRRFQLEAQGGKSHGSPAHVNGHFGTDVWVSKDGNSRVNVGGKFDGPVDRPKFNEGRVNFEHRW